MKRLDDYRGIETDAVLDEIRQKGKQLSGTSAVHVNATAVGGGVAEILDNLVLLSNDVGLRTDWRVIHGTAFYFEVTKKFHNALQGQDVSFDERELDLYKRINEKFGRFAFLDHDVVIIHDPQPLALIDYVPNSRPWTWRCHIDITKPNKQAWEFIEPYILQYKRMIVSADGYKRPDLSIEQRIVYPSIDPLSPKNRDLSDETMDAYLKAENVPTDKPLITQVSRFDPWKNPEGLLDVFQKVKKEVDCRLVFVYNMASDDPEGVRVYNKMRKLAKPYLESNDVLFVRGDDPALVNALQRRSTVVVQNSTREGFGLVVTEALWKETPVVARRVGGIPEQIEDGATGFLVERDDDDGFAAKIVQLLQDSDMAAEMGRQARQSVRRKFLITRHLLDYLNLFEDVMADK
jgi:trehalose synthase